MYRLKTVQIKLKTLLRATLLVAFLTSIAITGANAEVGNNYDLKSVKQTPVTVTGKVLAADDRIGLPGVNIAVKGTGIGTITDFDGNFRIEVPSTESVLVFSFVGYKNQEVKVGTQTKINIDLQTADISFDEIVVVGYGTQKKANLTGSIDVVSSEELVDKAVTSPALSLQGKTPGLVVTRSSSRPGNEGIGFAIRGATSVNGGSPLIIIDGTPAINNEAFFNMNQDDIESISVLKDASAAIYGSRAANGVILVVTKKGKGKPTIDINSTLRINTIGIKPPFPSMQDYATVWLEAAEQDGVSANYWGWQSKENLLKMQSGYEGIYPTAYWGDIFIGNYNRFDEMFGTSASNQHNVSISGGTEISSYRVSLGYAEDIGALKTAYDGKKQYNARLSYDFKANDWLRFETGMSYVNYRVSSPSTGLDVTAVANDPPFFPAKNPYGQWYANFNIAGNRNAIAATVDGGRENTKRDQYKLQMAAIVDIFQDLSFRATASFDKDFYDYQKYVVTVPQYSWYGSLAPESVNSTSDIREKRVNKLYQNYGGFFNYAKTIFDSHNITAMIGGTAELGEDKTTYGYRKGFVDEDVYDINLGSLESSVEATGGAGHWGFLSYIGRFTYNYQEKYLFELSGRRDGSSKFSDDNRWSNFGTVLGGWVISKENFMETISFINFLKLRGSYGQMGSQIGIGNYDYVSTIGNGSAIFGSTAAKQNTAYVSAITSKTRTWERVSIATLGVDFTVFNDKISGSFDLFKKKNDDMLIEINYPDLLGGSAPKTNNGTLETNGWEAILSFRDSFGDFKFNVSVNLSNTKNKLVSMEGMDTWTVGKIKAREGYALNTYFLYETDGFFKDENDVNSYYDKYTASVQGELPSGTDVTQRLRAGDTKKVDLDGNGYIDDIGNGVDDTGDVKDMGDDIPHYVYGINLGFGWKGLDFSAFFQGVLEQNVMRSGYVNYPFGALYTNQTNAYIGKTWTPDNTGADYPRMTANTTRAKWNWSNNDFALQKNRYLRCKSITLGYTFSDLNIMDLNFSKIRFYFAGNDLFEFTSIKDGFDPEFGESSNSAYPFTRTWALGLNLTF